MGVKTAECVACKRDMPKAQTEVIVREGYELIVCVRPTECRTYWREESQHGNPKDPDITSAPSDAS